MKKLLLSFVVLAISLTATLNAQEEGRRRGGNRGFQLPQELNLTAEQQQKVDSVNADFRTKMTDLRGKSDLSQEDRRAKMQEMRKVYLDAINGVLTPEQQAKLKELQTQRQREVSMRGKMQGNKKQMATPPVGGLKGLNLTDDQKQKIKALTEEYKVKSKELALQHREALNNVYTPEQQAKLKDMWKNAPVHKFSKGERGGMKLNDANAAKLKSLKKSYDKDKEAI